MSQLLDDLGSAIARAGLTDLALTGQLVGWRRTPAWGQGELIANELGGTDIVARLPLSLPGRVAAAVEARCAKAGTSLSARPTVAVTGGLEVHPRYGPVRFVARTMHLDDHATAGAHAARAAIEHQLAAQGVLDQQKALQLPTRIARIGTVAGAGTAAQADFRERISRLVDAAGLHEINVPTTGPAAPAALVAAIGRLARRDLDCIAVLRGGGPAADLAAFDHPDVATAIGRCSLPVLTGIGHATNTTLADRAAHRALPTPSAVADHIGRHNAATTLTRTTHDAAAARTAQQAALRDLERERRARQATQARLRAALIVTAYLIALVAALILVR